MVKNNSWSKWSPAPCQISPPSVQRVAPARRKTSKSASESTKYRRLALRATLPVTRAVGTHTIVMVGGSCAFGATWWIPLKILLWARLMKKNLTLPVKVRLLLLLSANPSTECARGKRWNITFGNSLFTFRIYCQAETGMSCAPRNGLMSGWGGIRKTIIICPQCAFRVKEYGFRILSCTTGDGQFCFHLKRTIIEILL